MCILITGLGYIGSQLALDLLDRGETVIALESFFSTPRDQVKALRRARRLEVVEGSINSAATINKLIQRVGPRTIVHLAAQPSAHPKAASPHYTEQTNLVGSRLVLEAARQAAVDTVILGSSFKVYGEQLPPRVSEDQPYGAVRDLAHLSKIYTEKLAEMMSQTGGPRAVSVRLGITHGLAPVMKSDPRFMTVPNLFALLAQRQRPLEIHPTASAPAGFIHVRDASKALLAALDTHWESHYQIINAVTEVTSVAAIANLVRIAGAERGLQVEVHGPAGAREDSIKVESSISKVLETAPISLSSSAGEVLDYFADPT